MSDDSFRSNSQSYFSSSTDYKPAGYTDFTSESSKSYNYDSDSFSKKYDDYSSFSSDNTSKKQQSSPYSSYSSYGAQNSYYNSASDSSFDPNVNQKSNQSQIPMYEAQTQKSRPTSYQQTANLGQQRNVEVKQSKPVQRYTIRDVLELPLDRQQYLKTLPIENLRTQPQYGALLKRPNVVLGIADYYQKVIPDQSFNSQVKSLKRGKDVKEALWLASIIGYLALTGKLQTPNSSFKGVFKGKSHFMIPVALTALMMIDNKWTKEKTRFLIYDDKNSRNVDIALRKFICQTNHKERVAIFGQT